MFNYVKKIAIPHKYKALRSSGRKPYNFAIRRSVLLLDIIFKCADVKRETPYA